MIVFARDQISFSVVAILEDTGFNLSKLRNNILVRLNHCLHFSVKIGRGRCAILLEYKTAIL